METPFPIREEDMHWLADDPEYPYQVTVPQEQAAQEVIDVWQSAGDVTDDTKERAHLVSVKMAMKRLSPLVEVESGEEYDYPRMQAANQRLTIARQALADYDESKRQRPADQP